MFNYQKFEKDFIEAWNSHDIEYLLSFYTDELVYIHPGEHPRVIKGKEQFKKYLEVFKTFPDYKFELINVAWNDNIGFGEWIGRSTFNGKRYGLEIKNKKFEIIGVDILIIDKEKELVKEESILQSIIGFRTNM